MIDSIESAKQFPIVATREFYNDNDGAYCVAYILHEGDVIQYRYADGYNNNRYDALKVNASESEKQQAREILEKKIVWPDHDAEAEWIGLTVVTKRSRKVLNGIEYVVEDYVGARRNHYMQWESPKVKVNGFWTSANCIDKITKMKTPGFIQ